MDKTHQGEILAQELGCAMSQSTTTIFGNKGNKAALNTTNS